MKKIFALLLVLGLFTGAPGLAAEDSILTGASQHEFTILLDTEMSRIQGELHPLVIELLTFPNPPTPPNNFVQLLDPIVSPLEPVTQPVVPPVIIDLRNLATATCLFC